MQVLLCVAEPGGAVRPAFGGARVDVEVLEGEAPLRQLHELRGGCGDSGGGGSDEGAAAGNEEEDFEEQDLLKRKTRDG